MCARSLPIRQRHLRVKNFHCTGAFVSLIR
jgi:hypothetical protein